MSDVPPDHAGEISADGKWRWDGQAWQSVEGTTPPTAPVMPGVVAVAEAPAATLPTVAPGPVPAQPRRRGWLGIAAASIVALIVGGVCGLAVGSSNASNSSLSASSSSPSAHAGAPATSTQAEFLAYSTVVSTDAPIAANAFGSMGTDCGNLDVSKCRSDVDAARTTDQQFLSDLAKLSVPACLAATNQELSSALNEAVDAETTIIKGLDASDSTQITEGADFLGLATDHLNKATSLIKTNPCG